MSGCLFAVCALFFQKQSRAGLVWAELMQLSGAKAAATSRCVAVAAM